MSEIEAMGSIIRTHGAFGCDCCTDLVCERPECIDATGFPDHYNDGCGYYDDRGELIARTLYEAGYRKVGA